MTTIKEIEAAIDRLPRRAFFRLSKWVRARSEDEWDRQIAEDVQAGKLDRLAQAAITEHRAGRTTPPLNQCLRRLGMAVGHPQTPPTEVLLCGSGLPAGTAEQTPGRSGG